MSDSIHIELEINKMILSVCDEAVQCHQDAKFWLPWCNWDRFNTYCKLSSITKIQASENGKMHLARLVAGRIIHLRTK